MARRFAYVYFMKDRPHRIREVAAYHIDYWTNSGVERCVHGPFMDRTGGLICFQAVSLGEAEAIVEQDPFVVHALLEERWVKEWMVRPQERPVPCLDPEEN